MPDATVYFSTNHAQTGTDANLEPSAPNQTIRTRTAVVIGETELSFLPPAFS